MLYKNHANDKVEDIPEGLSRTVILEALHDHNLMVRTLHPDDEIKRAESPSTSLDSTTFSIRMPKHDFPFILTLTSLPDGFGVTIRLPVSMGIDCQWTIHERGENPDSLYLLEETSSSVLKPFLWWMRYNPQTKPPPSMARILGLLNEIKRDIETEKAYSLEPAVK